MNISLILSILAIILSITVAVVEYVRDYNINKVNLESEYYKELFKDYLLYDLPKARKYIRFNSADKLVDTDNMINELQNLLQDSLYFQYSNQQFYQELKKIVQQFEDYLVQQSGEIFDAQEKQDVYKKIQDYIVQIYEHISKGYIGKYRSKKIKKEY